jgi:hypothetical protein
VTAEPGVEEASIEAVAGSDGISGFDEEGCDPIALDAVRGLLLDERAAGSALDDDQGDAGGEGIEGLVEGRLAGDSLEFLFVGEEEVYFLEERGKDAAPVAGGVVIGIE